MTIQSLAQDIESQYEGETCEFMAKGPTYLVQTSTSDPETVKVTEYFAGGGPTGVEYFEVRKSCGWRN